MFAKLKESLSNRASSSEIYGICKQYREYGIDSNLIYDYLYDAIRGQGYSLVYKNIVFEILNSLSGRCDSDISLEGAGVVNIYLDDLRETPDLFIRTYTPSQTILLLNFTRLLPTTNSRDRDAKHLCCFAYRKVLINFNHFL